MSLVTIKNVFYKMCLGIKDLMYVYKKDLALNNLKWLIYDKTKPNQTKQIKYLKS